MEDDVKALLIRIADAMEEFANGMAVLIKMNRRQAVAQEAIAEEMLDQDTQDDPDKDEADEGDFD